MTAVAVWDHRPSPRELLEERQARGWKPTPSGLKGGDRVLGYAACIFETPGFPTRTSELPVTDRHARLRTLAARRWRVAISLTAIMALVYFGFIALIAYNKPLLATTVVPGLSLGILLGALVIATSWLLTWIYVRWANRHYDAELEKLR